MPTHPGSTIFEAVTVPGVYLADAVMVAAHMGFDHEPFLASLNLRVEQLFAPGFRLPADSYNQAIASLVEVSGIQSLGLQVMREKMESELGALGRGMERASSYRRALGVWLQYQDITGPVARLSLIEREGSVILSVIEGGLTGAALRYEMQNLFLAAVMAMTPKGEKTPATRVSFTFDEPHNVAIYLECFGCQVEFAQPHNELWMSAELLKRTPPLADPDGFELYRVHCEAIHSKLMFSGTLPEQIRSLLIAGVGRLPSEERIADTLNMSTRTLRRRLAEQGIVFRDILNEVRTTLAQEYLRQSSVTVAEISSLVGYSNVPSFYRAFKRITGKTPSEYRDSARLSAKRHHLN